MIEVVCLLCTLASCSCDDSVTSNDAIVGNKPTCETLRVEFTRYLGDAFLVLGPNVPCKVSIAYGYSSSSLLTSQWLELTNGILLTGGEGYVEVTIYPQKKAKIPWVGGYIESSACDELYVSTNFSENSVKTPYSRRYGCYVDGRARPVLTFAPGTGSSQLPSYVDVYMFDEYGEQSSYDGYSPVTGVFGAVRGYAETIRMKVISSEPTDEVIIDSLDSNRLIFVDGRTGEAVKMNPGRCKSYTKCEGLPGFDDPESPGPGKAIGIAIGVILIVLLLLLIFTCLYWRGKLN